MKNILFVFLISFFSFTIISCSEEEEEVKTGLFVSVGKSGTILTSSDGITWTSSNSGTSFQLNGVTRHIGKSTNGKFLAVGHGATVLVSPNAISWEQFKTLKKRLWGVTYANSTFITVGNSGRIYTSTDGVLWDDKTNSDVTRKKLR